MKKQGILLFLCIIFSIPALAQFPLGSRVEKIKAYFADNIPYAAVQEFKTPDGINALCFTKVKVVGDYTFYFDANGNCSSYIVTYDNEELPDLIRRFDLKFCRIHATEWAADDSSFDVTLLSPKPGENFFSIVYQPMHKDKFASSLASN